ncbi:hypothetical protein FWH30_01570 [Microgenomates group bacterium]|nr:hypothetical protein [Microgenomates group bacterium]
MSKKNVAPVVIVTILAIGAGVGIGYGLRRASSDAPISLGGEQVAIPQVADEDKPIQAGDTFGSTNAEDFKDHTTGYLEEGGIDGEGTHRLLRPGGQTQTVYLISSVTDLDRFVGMEVEIWGETLGGQKAGWLMDVGRIKVSAVKGISPEATR